MKKVKFIALFLVLMAAASAQTMTLPHRVRTKFTKSTDVKVENFRIKEAATVYDLALNLSYFHHLSQGFTRECLTLPVVLIDNNFVFDDKLADTNMSEVEEYTFKWGAPFSALYGSKGHYGVLSISLKEEGADE